MSDTSDKSKPEDKLSLDLSSLQDLNFGPDWSDSARAAESRGKGKPAKGGGGKRPQRDRRPDRPPRRQDAGQADGAPRQERFVGGGRPPRGERRDGGPRRDRQSAPPFKPVVDVAFYPEDTPFKALCHAMRGNCRTYELFEIARLILDKPDRFVVVLHPKKNEGPQEFFTSVPDGLPFTSEDQAVSHVLKHHLDKFAQMEEIEVDPPKGNFPAINKCGVTGALLGPPNYHRYQSLLHEHHAVNLPNMPYEKFLSRIESVKDEAVVQQWIEKMRKETRYVVKMSDDEAQAFDNLESLKFYLVNQRKAEVVRPTNQARFSGAQAEQLPNGPLKDSIFGWREQQQRFPLETANNLRGRLRRMHFTIYKRGSKGASFVCAVKRKFRTPQTRLAESLQELIDFIEKHPNINVAELPEQFLGIDVKKAKTPVEVPTEKAPDIEAVPDEEAQKIVEKHEQKRAARQAAEAGEAPAGSEATAEAAEAVEAPESAEPEAVEAPAPQAEPVAEDKPATAKPAASDSLEDPNLRQLMFDLRWLVTEGYVTEYGDGRLFAPPPMDEASRKEDAPRKDGGKRQAKQETGDDSDSDDADSLEESDQPEASEDDAAVAAAREPQDQSAETPADAETNSTDGPGQLSPAAEESAPSDENGETKREEAGQPSAN